MRSEGQLEVEFDGVLDVKGDVWPDEFFEAGFFDLELIRAGREIGQLVFAGGVGVRFVMEVGGGVGGGDFGVGD